MSVNKLTSPNDIQSEPDKGTKLLTLIEEQLSLVKIKKTDPDNRSQYRITVKIDGHFSKEDCSDVYARYRRIGWDNIKFRKEYISAGLQKSNCTYVTFFQKKDVMRNS